MGDGFGEEMEADYLTRGCKLAVNRNLSTE